jgi:hypothetical protein
MIVNNWGKGFQTDRPFNEMLLGGSINKRYINLQACYGPVRAETNADH